MTFQFRMAERTPDQQMAALSDVDQAFAMLKSTDGKGFSRAGAKALKDMEFDLGSLVVQLVNDQMLTQDPTPMMVNVIDGNYPDDYVYQEVTSALRVVDRAPGSKPQSQRLSFAEWGIQTSQKEIIAEIPLEQIASGRYTASMVVQALTETKLRHTIGQILDGLDAGVPAGADRSGRAGYTLRYAGFTEANLSNAIDGLMDEGFLPTIFGRWLPLAGIRGFAGWSTGKGASEAQLREFETRGLVGQFQGAPVVAISDRYSRKHQNHVIRYDRVYLSANGPDKGAIFLRKNLSFLDFSEILPAEGIMRVGMRFEDGLLVWDAFKHRIITIA
jgi:hypothetical protein